MFVAWVLFPALLGVLCLGCGLLVERAAGRRLPGPLLPSVGLALIVVSVFLATSFQLGAQIAPAIPVMLAVAGFAVGWRRLVASRPDVVAIGLVVLVFATLSLAVIPHGDATWTGYYRLNDSVVHFSVVEWVFEHGRTPPDAFESAYHATARTYLEAGYPIGAHMPLGAVRTLVGSDTPWLLSPYLAFLLALTGAAIYTLLWQVRPTAMRALASFLAVVAGLVTAYFVAGNIKEIAALWAMVTAVAVALSLIRPPPGLRAVLPFAIVLLAGFFILNLAIGPWLIVASALMAIAVIRGWSQRGWRESAPEIGIVGVAAAAVIVLSLGAIERFTTAAEGVLTEAGDLGNLARPVSLLEVFGVWPIADYRFPLDEYEEIGTILIGVVIVAFALGAVSIVRGRFWGAFLLLASAVLAGAILGLRGSPYADAKTMMIVSPAIVMTAVLGAASLHHGGRRLEGWLLAAALIFGVLWTNGLVLSSPAAAPRDRYEEVAQMSEQIAEPEQTFFNGWDEFLAYFGRKTHATGQPFLAPEMREDLPLREGERVKYPFDLDELTANFVQSWPTIVLSRSPFASRPPANFEPFLFSDHYEAWRRNPASELTVLEHYPLGNPFTPAGTPDCDWVRRLGRRAERQDAQLAYFERPRVSHFIPTRDRPSNWGVAPGDPATLVPVGPGTVSGSMSTPRPARYDVWIQGQFDRQVEVRLDGATFSVADQLGPPGQFVKIGQTDLNGGVHRIRITAGSTGPFNPPPTQGRIGPIVLSPADIDLSVGTVAADDAEDLCGRRLDWIELVRPA